MGWWGISTCSSSSIKNWLLGWMGLCPTKSRKRAWIILFFAVVWSIWECRNDVVFRGSLANLEKTLDMIKFRVALWFKNHGVDSEVDLSLLILDVGERCVDSTSIKAKIFLVWTLPFVSELSFNVDGSARGDLGDAGIGGVLRDSCGKMLCLFSFYMGVSDATSAEIFTIHRACQLVVYNQIFGNRNITIFSDSKSVVSWCNGEDFGNLSLVNLLYNIRQILHSLDCLTIKFMPRGSNSFADCLAKNGSSCSGDRLEWGDIS